MSTRDWLGDARCGVTPGFTELRPSVQKQRCAPCPVKAQCKALGMEIAAEYADVNFEGNRVVFGGFTLGELRATQTSTAA